MRLLLVQLASAIPILASMAQAQARDEPTLLVVDRVEEGVLGESASVVETETLVTRYADAPTVGMAFQIEVDETGPYTLELRSYYFDGYLVLRDAAGLVLAEDDDGLIGRHAKLVVELEAGLSHRVEACALHDGRGPFELFLKRGAADAPSAADLELDDAERRVESVERHEGPESANLALAFNQLGFLLMNRGQPERARPSWERALEISEKVHGPEHPDTASDLSNLAGLYQMLGDNAAAMPLVERALAISERIHGPDHPNTAVALNNMALVFDDLGDHAAARPLYERSLAICEAKLGLEHQDTLGALQSLGLMLEEIRDLAGARSCYERLLEGQVEVHGPDHPETFATLNQLSIVVREQGDFAGAVPLMERVIAYQERALGPDHPGTTSSINNLASLYHALGHDDAARPLLERALESRRRVLGPEHPRTLRSLGNLAAALRSQGEDEEAREMYERTLAIGERVLGEDHPQLVNDLQNLGNLFVSQGKYASARPLLERALAISERAFGPDHEKTAVSLNRLAGLLKSQGDLDAAGPLFERALAINERVHGPDHPSTANVLNGLATLYDSQGKYAAARAHYERVIDIWERIGPEHPDFSGSLNNLAELLTSQREFDAAWPLYERALAIRERGFGGEGTVAVLSNMSIMLASKGELSSAQEYGERAAAYAEEHIGPDHPGTAKVLSSLAKLRSDQGDLQAAWTLARRAYSGSAPRVEMNLASFSESDRYPYLAALLWQLELQLSLARELGDPAARTDAYEAVLGWKGRVGRLLLASREQLMARMGADAKERMEDLHRCQAQLSRLALVSDVRDPEEHDRRLFELRNERGRLERELLQGGGRLEATRFVDLREALEPGSVLIDFFAHNTYRPGAGKQGSIRPRRLTAWITRAGLESPIEIDFGLLVPIEEATRAHLQEIADPDLRSVARGFVADTQEGAPSSSGLRELLWDPIAPHLRGIETVFVSPDAFLGTLPLETLPLAEGELAIERYSFVYLADAASLVTRGAGGEAELDSLLAVGAIDFDGRSSDVSALAASSRSSIALRGDFDGAWKELPATGPESRAVSDLHLRVFGEDGRRLLLQRTEPSEERLKHELPRHRVLHLATHGYFHPEGMPSLWGTARNEAAPTRLSEEARHLVGRHPGLLSGLVCAGANRDDGEGDDGYLTAEEVGWLDLSGVELVVLSACETGLGRPQSGEGLIGLRRAFQTAGAKTVVSSLWSVQDESTAELMRDFYENLWLNGMGRHQALRAAQLAMLERNRLERGEPRPSTWGAFVLSGEWR